MRRTIEHFIMMGDSLSDRGTMDHRKLFGVIPMNGLSGLKGKSALGRFTNGYVWNDEFSTYVSSEAIIRNMKAKGKSAMDIADAVINKDTHVINEIENDFHLDSDKHVTFQHQDYVRNYDEGGLTAYDYHRRITANLKYLATEQILSNLDQKCELLLQDDKARAVSQEHKEKTLIVEWSGANDLVTVNAAPTFEAADKAIAARIQNVEKLVKNGYRNFVLFNLPDLSLTPRFQNKHKSDADRENAHAVSMYFNENLAKAMHELKLKHTECSMNVFDVNHTFTEVFKNPKKFGLDPAKKSTPYTSSPDFKLKSKDTSPAKGYMFWDDVHPTAHVHTRLGNEFYDQYSLKYNFSAPHESLIEIFRETYGQRAIDNQRGFFSGFHRSKFDYKNASLEQVLDHALYKKGTGTKEVLIELGWIDKKGNLLSTHPSLVKAMEEIKSRHKNDAGSPGCLC